MNAGELHRLARHLREIATQATTAQGESPASPGLIAVVEDVSRHPHSTITDIVNRTRLAQSFVSKTVADMRAAGILSTTPDPSDGRRVRVQLAPEVKQDILLPRGQASLTDTLTRTHPQLTPQERQRAETLFDELFRLLQP